MFWNINYMLILVIQHDSVSDFFDLVTKIRLNFNTLLVIDFTLDQGTIFEEKSLAWEEHTVGLYLVFVIVPDIVSSGTSCGHSCTNLPCMELQ